MIGSRVAHIAIFSVMITGCATSFTGQEGRVRDSALSNLSPAPAAMTPVLIAPDGDPTLDPTYMASQADYHFTMGEALSLEGRSEKAVESFKSTLIYDPNSVVVRLRLAQEYARLGQMTEAIEQAEAAVELDPTSEMGRSLLGGLYSSLKMYQPALQQYQEMMKAHPENTDAPIYIGAILAEQKMYDLAVEHFNKVAKNPKSAEPERAYYYIGRIRSEQEGEQYLKQAEAAFAEALKLKPNYPDAVLALATLMKEQGRDAASLKLLVSFQDKFGPKRDIAKVLSRVYLEKEEYEKAYEQLEILEGFERDNLNVRVQMALILIEQKKYEAAIIRLEDILAVSPDLDKIRYYLGAVYSEMKNDSMAISNYMMVPPSSSYYTESIIQSAHLHKQKGRLKEAIEVVQAGIQYREDIPQFYAYYATLLDDAKQFQRAISMLDKAVKKFPDHAQLHFFLGSMHDRVGNHKETIDTMKKVLEIDSDHVQALNYLAYTYAEQNIELEEAEAMARRALAMQPNDGYILDTVGWVMFKKGKTEVAIRYLEAAYKAKGDEAIIAEHLADAYFRNQMLDKARALYRRASELETDDGKLGKIKEKLAATERQIQTTQRLPASTSEHVNP